MNKTHKVLVITNMYPSQEHRQFGIFVHNQVEAMRQRNVEIDVVAITNPRNGKWNVIKKYVKWGFQTLRKLVTSGHTYSVVHAHYVFPSGLLALLFKKVYGTRMIITAHGGDIDKMAVKSKWLTRMTKYLLKEADHTIAVGVELKQKLLTTYEVKESGLTLLNMGVNRNVFRPIGQARARERCEIAENEHVILFVGNLLRQKGLSELIEAVSILHQGGEQVNVYLIGSERDQAYLQCLRQQINDQQLVPFVHFLGVKEQPEIAQWMNAADVLVLPSHMEGFGLVALEAMACGTPVVGTNVGGLQTLLADDAGVITNVGEPTDLARGIKFVLSSEDTRAPIICNGLKKAEENDQEWIHEQLERIYFPSGG